MAAMFRPDFGIFPWGAGLHNGWGHTLALESAGIHILPSLLSNYVTSGKFLNFFMP